MSAYEVGLVDIGEDLPFNVQRLATKLNSLQLAFHFQEAGVITAQVQGDPDIEEEWYDTTRLLELISAKADSNQLDFIIGLTRSKITNKLELSTKPDKDYFSMSDFKKLSVISVNGKVLKYNPKHKSIEAYVAHLIIGELLINLSRENLSHLGEVLCVLNECEDRDTLSDCIKAGRICTACVAKLKEKNVGDSVIASAKKVLSWSTRNTWGYSVKNILLHPVPSLAFGVGLGWFTSEFVPSPFYPVMIIVILVAAISVMLLTRFAIMN
jgi:hypothetical protein